MLTQHKVVSSQGGKVAPDTPSVDELGTMREKVFQQQLSEVKQMKEVMIYAIPPTSTTIDFPPFLLLLLLFLSIVIWVGPSEP